NLHNHISRDIRNNDYEKYHNLNNSQTPYNYAINLLISFSKFDKLVYSQDIELLEEYFSMKFLLIILSAEEVQNDKLLNIKINCLKIYRRLVSYWKLKRNITTNFIIDSDNISF